MHGRPVTTENGFLVEDFVALITRVELGFCFHGVLAKVLRVLGLDVLGQTGELVVAVLAGFPHSHMHHALVPRQVVLLTERLQADLTNVLRGRLHVVCLEHVRLQVVELLVTNLANLLSAVGFENLWNNKITPLKNEALPNKVR